MTMSSPVTQLSFWRCAQTLLFDLFNTKHERNWDDGKKERKEHWLRQTSSEKNTQLLIFFSVLLRCCGAKCILVTRTVSGFKSISFARHYTRTSLPPSLLLLCPLPQSIYLTSTRSRRSAKLADIKKRETSNDEHLFIFCPLIVLGRRKSEVSTQNIKNTVIIHAPLASNRRHPTSTIRKFIKTTLKARSTFIPSLQRG